MARTGVLLAVLPAALAALGAAPATAPSAAVRQAFLEQPVLYLTIEITQNGSHAFGAPKDAVSDGAHRTSQSVGFELPLDTPMPGTPPAGSMPLTPADMMEPDRFITWMAMPPMDEATDALTNGTLDLAKSGMFLPGRFSIDDVSQFRYRDMPTEGWATRTTTRKGRGTVYAGRSGSLGCDLKTMTCDLGGVSLGFHDGADLVTLTTTDDLPGSQAKHETTGPAHLLPRVPQEIAKRLIGFPLTLPLPSTFTWSGPPASTGPDSGDTITVKVTIAAVPAAKAGTVKPKP